MYKYVLLTLLFHYSCFLHLLSNNWELSDIIKIESLDNAIYSTALIGLAIMVYEPLYHALQIW